MSLLSCTGLTMRFGGLAALNKLDVHVEEGDVIGLVGPNGSGKTTFFNVLTGIYTPSEGRIVFDGQDITAKTPQEICRAGIARTFQRSRLCLELTVFDNVMMGNSKNLNLGFWHNVIRRKAFFQECRDDEARIRLMLKALNPTLADKIRKPVGELSMIDRRRVEICRALTGRPRLLLLDEPSAGMTQDETRQLMDELVAMEFEGNRPSIILIEHEMSVIKRISTRCIVLNFGRKLCEGSYDEVTSNPVVQQAYLGTEVV
ncbi:ABC transporter ATP-binding protein [uncultured Mailhella sp.]|uniref:ABC transporter ATP-binding protein n=1 Tax=uncultured Mailhella sp. TaxID=1981031 RepID=UPI0025E4B532|nr:ABC transporter ATP-binding protein [uncultured Mailhella sp.]